ncbi:MAG: ABC transporter ATP-binding protein [Microcella sp.]
MTTAPAISTTGVARSFGDVQAVRDASFEAHHGQVTALIGPNGSGKTTLLLMLATLLKPDAGQIRVEGHDPLTAPREVRRAIGWMPDILGSWNSLTVRQALDTTARLYEFTPKDAAARADELIERIGLRALADQPSRVLSRGQKQKLSLARALVHRPRVLLLDEPASGLDPAARVELRQLVRELAADGAAVLLSSHVLAELDEMSDAAVYLDRGATATVESVQAAKATARRWRIRALDPAALDAALAATGRPAVGADHLGTLVEITGEADAAELLGQLVAAGVGITAYGPAVGDLEQTFLDLAKGGER